MPHQEYREIKQAFSIGQLLRLVSTAQAGRAWGRAPMLNPSTTGNSRDRRPWHCGLDLE